MSPRELHVQTEVKDKKLRAALKDEALLKSRYGVELAKKLKLRVGALEAALSLADFWPPFSLPERVHELKGNLKGVFSMDLIHPQRLLFRPLEDSPPDDRSDEQARWKSIEGIEITGIEDTHG
jgi:plasmid maintenance system killer protein